jgi:Zn-dependent peptidase ImmA (M78 family)
MTYQVVLGDMPIKTKALSCMNEDGSFTIFLNARLSYEQQRNSFFHELKHISNNDFYDHDADRIEKKHRRY